MHELYLQLRQDILSGTLTGPKQSILESGSIALQAEFSDRPKHVTEYFDVHNYLPATMLTGMRGEDLKNLSGMLVQRHAAHSGTQRKNAERSFIELCQSFSSFGAQFYAVHKFKVRTEYSLLLL
jgi:hypothetical protein